MRRALQLAALGKGAVAPNPLVACVIVHPEKGIIGEGYHKKYGGPHAEVNAIAEVKNQEWLSESTLYVNLEPCSHFGKTPPCADLILSKKIPKVVVCNPDPHPLVAGRGIEKLSENGVEVQVGLLKEEGEKLNRIFFTAVRKKRPFVTLKWAETSDGFIARQDGSSKWISSAESRQLGHKLRTEHQSILIGKNTALFDNPALTSRNWPGPDPIRLVWDARLELPSDLQLFTDAQAETCIFNSLSGKKQGNLIWYKIDFQNPVQETLQVLYDQGIHSVLVEGGSRVLKQFIDEGLWDEAWVFVSKIKFKQGIAAPRVSEKIMLNQFSSGGDLAFYFCSKVSF